MYLQKLEIQGFKSFAQKTTLEFNQKLTAIVGPNGSGKSNVADAVRWVLGEQSVKLLRGKRAEDVIFAGSDRKTRSGLAEVNLYLNNEDSSAPIDYSEIVITRRLYRDGQSEYLLNNRPVRLSDVNLLLARANFGQKTYSVIGQGMIDSILLSSPADRKEFFEEATGIKQYQIKREQSISKLLSTYDNLEQVELVLKEIVPRLRTLTRQVKRLERREELEGLLTELQKDYFGFRWGDLSKQHFQTDQQQQQLATQITSARREVKQLEEKMKGLEQAELLPAAYRQLKSEHEKKRNELTNLLKEQALASAQDELKHLQKGEGEIVWLKRRQQELRQEINQDQSDLTALTISIKQLQSQLIDKVKEQSKLVDEMSALSSRQELPTAWRAKLVSLSQRYDSWLTKITNITTLKELTALLPQAQTIKQELQILKQEIEHLPGSSPEQLHTQKDELIEEIAQLKVRITHQTEAQSTKQTRITKLTEEEAKLSEILTGQQVVVDADKLAEQIKETDATIHKLEQELARFHESAESKKQEFFTVQNDLQKASQRLHNLEQRQHELALTLAKIDTKKEDLEREMSQEIPPELVRAVKESPNPKTIDEGEVALEIQKLKRQLEVTGGIEPEIVSEYQQTKERHDFLSGQETDLKQAINSLETIIHELDQTISKQFLANFKAINEKFAKFFQLLFDGGKAQLSLQKFESATKEEKGGEDEENQELEEVEKKPETQMAREKFLLQEKLKASMFSGVEMQATPPGKKLSSINALSGGEKALASIALICAIISHLPSPFVVLDEVDAALDEANSERFAAILDNLSQTTQFITITHNRATMSRTAILYGVTMGDDGISRLLSVKLDQAKEMVNT
ncbi:MAG: AAA family ATPase [Patescibacteria group bacterium]